MHDIDIINTELLLADLDTVEKRPSKAEKAAKSASATAAAKTELSTIQKLLEVLNAGKPARTADLEDAEKLVARDLFLITMKPQLYVANVDEAGIRTAMRTRSWWSSVRPKRAARSCGSAARWRLRLRSWSLLSEPNFWKLQGLEEPGLNRLIHAAYRLLGLITYFTSGVQEVRAWTIKRGTKAPGAAGVIHSDFERGFIKADCYACEDLFRLGSEQAVKEAGLLRSEGKEYVVKDGDILFFKFNV